MADYQLKAAVPVQAAQWDGASQGFFEEMGLAWKTDYPPGEGMGGPLYLWQQGNQSWVTLPLSWWGVVAPPSGAISVYDPDTFYACFEPGAPA